MKSTRALSLFVILVVLFAYLWYNGRLSWMPGYKDPALIASIPVPKSLHQVNIYFDEDKSTDYCVLQVRVEGGKKDYILHTFPFTDSVKKHYFRNDSLFLILHERTEGMEFTIGYGRDELLGG